METKIDNRFEAKILNQIKNDKCLNLDLFINKRNEVEIDLKLFDSIHITSNGLKTKDIRFKVSLDLLNQRDCDHNTDGNHWQTDPVLIAVMSENECQLKPQEPKGRIYSSKEYVLFRTKVKAIEEMAFIVELYSRESDSEIDSKAIGFCNIFASHLKDTTGIISMPINGQNGKIIAQLHLEYLILSPIKDFEDFHKMILVESWLTNAKGYDVGHRGAGIARRTDCSENILENTIASFNFASLHGADMVELDVQLSKDKIPLVYHDFDVNIIIKNKKSKSNLRRESSEVHTMAVKDLTFRQLQSLQLSPVIKENKTFYDFGEEDETEDNMPFVSLQKVLESVDPKCGLNLEIKYPQQKICGQWEAEKTFDLNEYVDIILSIVFNYAGARNIMFSCFHPDICALLKYKQKRYPVLFLTQGLTKKWQQFRDRRNASIEMAAYFAQCVGLEGISVHAEDIISDRDLIKYVKSKDLILFCWGEDLNKKELILELKQEGVDGVIYDRIDILCAKALSLNK